MFAEDLQLPTAFANNKSSISQIKYCKTLIRKNNPHFNALNRVM